MDGVRPGCSKIFSVVIVVVVVVVALCCRCHRFVSSQKLLLDSSIDERLMMLRVGFGGGSVATHSPFQVNGNCCDV